MKRVTTGAYMMSAAHQSPNRKSPVPPKRARDCAHNCRTRSISSRTSGVRSLGGKLLRTFIGNSRRRLANPECISADIDRATARAVTSSGQYFSRPTRSARNSMIARLSQTTQSPSHRIGTLPSDGANSSPSRRLSQSASYSGTIYSSNSSPDCLAASHPRIDQLEYARLPMISLNKGCSLGRDGFEDCRSQLGDAATGFARCREDGGMRRRMLGGFDCDSLINGAKRRRLHLVGLRQHEVVADGRIVEHAHHVAVVLLEAVPRVDQDQSALQHRPAAEIVVYEEAPALDEVFR